MTPNTVWKSLKHDVKTDYLLVVSITNVYHLIQQQMKANKREHHNNASHRNLLTGCS